MGPALWDAGSKRTTLVFCFLFSFLLGSERPLPTTGAGWRTWGPTACNYTCRQAPLILCPRGPPPPPPAMGAPGHSSNRLLAPPLLTLQPPAHQLPRFQVCCSSLSLWVCIFLDTEKTKPPNLPGSARRLTPGQADGKGKRDRQGAVSKTPKKTRGEHVLGRARHSEGDEGWLAPCCLHGDEMSRLRRLSGRPLQ